MPSSDKIVDKFIMLKHGVVSVLMYKKHILCVNIC